MTEGQHENAQELAALRARVAQLEKPRFKWGRWVLGALGVLVALFVIAAITGPKTYQDLARSEAEMCVRHKGYGEWVGSSGVTLEQFCEGVGNIKALEQMRKDRPERF